MFGRCTECGRVILLCGICNCCQDCCDCDKWPWPKSNEDDDEDILGILSDL